MNYIKNKSASTFLIITALCYFTSCYYDVEQELYPTDPCDTTTVTFSNQITTTLQTYCLNCHSKDLAVTNAAGIVLETYDGIKAQVDNGKLISAITHDGNASKMPKGSGSKIPDCDIRLIQTWVDLGAPNN